MPTVLVRLNEAGCLAPLPVYRNSFDEAVGGQRVRVVGAERNPLVVSALREMLECDGRFELVNAVQSGKQFLDLAAEAGFDVAVIGWKLADHGRRRNPRGSPEPQA